MRYLYVCVATLLLTTGCSQQRQEAWYNLAPETLHCRSSMSMAGGISQKCPQSSAVVPQQQQAYYPAVLPTGYYPTTN